MKKLIVTLLLLLPLSILYSQDTIHVPDDYTTIQEAIDAANNGDIVLVAEDTYIENINFKGKAITVASHFLINGDETHIANTTIDGSLPSHPDSGSVVSFVSGEDTTSVICGFTITGGTGTLSLDGDVSGGGIFVNYSSAKICNNIIEYNSVINTTYANGGGIAGFAYYDSTNDGSIIIKNNIIRNNTATGNAFTTGGGISILWMGYVNIVNNIVIDNTVTDPSDGWSGGIEISGPSDEILVIGNYIKGNECDAGGGGIDFFECSPTFKNNLIVENSASDGGGVYLDLITLTSSKSDLNNKRRQLNRNNRLNVNQFNSSKILLASSFENNTIVNNSATGSGGGIYSGTALQFMNFIIWGNTAPADSQISGIANVQYSDVEGGYTGTGNINVNPEFDPTSEFYALLSSSQCIDAGNPDPMYNDVENPQNPGNPLPPAMGTLINDMGHSGGPASLWGFWNWPIPVELTSFTATIRHGKVNLYWTTATELNNLGFEIERKIIQNKIETQWVTIGFKEGKGTTTETQNYQFIDNINDIQASSLNYRLKQIDFDGSYKYSEEVFVDNSAPSYYALQQNYPNPFNPVTTIRYSLPVKSQVELVIYNALGESVRQLLNEEKPAGSYEVEFNANSLSSGVYFYKIQASNFVETKKMILMK